MDYFTRSVVLPTCLFLVPRISKVIIRRVGTWAGGENLISLVLMSASLLAFS